MAASKPEWVGMLEKQIEENSKYTTYALSTLSEKGAPRVRHVIHRGVTPSNLLLTTTDTRMQKPHELDSHHDIELAWWIEPTAVQFRIIGKAYTFSADQSETTKALKAMGITGEDGEAGWWEKKRKEVWEKEMSGHLRGSFARPQPGKPLSEIKEKPEDWPTRLDADSDDPEQKKLIELALSHFAMIGINANFAEYLELKPTPNRRTQWHKQEDGSWDKISVAP